VIALVFFNSFCFIFVIVGIALDCTNVLKFGKTVVDDKFNAPKDGARAVDMDMSHSAPSGPIPDKSQSTAIKEPTMNPIGADKEGGVDPKDIAIDIEPAGETPAKMIDNSPTPPKEEEPVSDVYGRPVTAAQLYCNAFRFYTRYGSMLYSSHSGSYRAVKALNSFAQLCIAMCIVCSIMGPLGSEF